jgi:hypothetical protein
MRKTAKAADTIPDPRVCIYNHCIRCPGFASGNFFGRNMCESGGIGRRTRLRIWRGNPWGFESPLSHQSPHRSSVVTRIPWQCYSRRP